MKRSSRLVAGAIGAWVALSSSNPAIAGVFTPLDLSGVSNGSPDVVDQAFFDGSLATEFDGTLLTDGGASNSPTGRSDGDFRLGALHADPNRTEVYRLDFDRPVILLFTEAFGVFYDGTSVTPFFGIFDSNDRWLIESPGVTFTVNDFGTEDLAGLVNAIGSVEFTAQSDSRASTFGDNDWEIRTSPLTTITLSMTNLETVTGPTGTQNVSPLNISAMVVAEPGSLALLGLGLAGLGASFRRARATPVAEGRSA